MDKLARLVLNGYLVDFIFKPIAHFVSEQEAIRAFKRAECKLWIVQQELIQS